MQSDSIGKLSMALTGLQAELRPVLKTEDGELSRYKYADLASCVAAAQTLLARFELSVVQTMGYVQDPIDGLVDTLKTQLSHSSGEWIRGEQLLYLTKKAKGGGNYESLDSQTQGGAITYARRYGFCAILGIVQEDDDAQQATQQQRRQVVEGPEPTDRPKYDRQNANASTSTRSMGNAPVASNAQSANATVSRESNLSSENADAPAPKIEVPKEEWTALLELADKQGWVPAHVKLSIENEDKRGRHKDERSLFNWAKAKFSKKNENAEVIA